MLIYVRCSRFGQDKGNTPAARSYSYTPAKEHGTRNSDRRLKSRVGATSFTRIWHLGSRLGNDGRRWQCKVFCRDLHFQIHLSFGRGRDGLLLHTFHTHVLALSFDLSKCHAYMCMGSRRNRKARGAHLYLCTVSKGGRQTNERCEKFLLVVGFYFFFLLTARNDAFEHVAKYDGRDELFTQGNAVKG